MSRGDCDVVDEAKSRWHIFPAMVTRWPNRDKGTIKRPRHHIVNGLACGSKSPLDCVERLWAYYVAFPLSLWMARRM